MLFRGSEWFVVAEQGIPFDFAQGKLLFLALIYFDNFTNGELVKLCCGARNRTLSRRL